MIGRLYSQPDGREKRVRLLGDDLEGRAGSDGPFYAKSRRLAERDVDAELVQ